MNRRLKKPFMLILLLALFSMAMSGAVYAQGKSDKHDGKKYDRYHSNSIINVETAVSLIVKDLNLNIDNLRFIKQPKASDYYTNVKDNAWYAGNFIIAQFNGIELPKNIDPNAKVTKEQFAAWLYGAMSHKGEYAWIERYIEIADADQVTQSHMNSIQKLLIANIATLDSKQKFYPKKGITRGEALAMIKKTQTFIKDAKQPIKQPVTPTVSDVRLTSDKLSDGVTKVTLIATAPHPGYGFEVASIQFNKGEAVIHYRVTLPNPDMMYAQVITEVKQVTYIPSSYKPVLGSSETVRFSK